MASIAMSRPARSPLRAAPLTRTERRRVAKWYCGALLVALAIPLIGVDVLGLHHDVYLLGYFTLVGTLLALFAAHTRLDWRRWLAARWWQSAGVGALVALATVRNVMGEASMPHPGGGFFWFELLWRGVLYGMFDALLLFVFPAAIAWLLVGTDVRRRRLRVALLTLVLSFGITATYHLGYPQFRDADLAQPEIGAVVANVPTVLTGNPIGSVVVHAGYHVAANVHTYRSEIFLPPDLAGYPERGGGTAGVGLAAGWIVLAGAVLHLERRRLFPPTEV